MRAEKKKRADPAKEGIGVIEEAVAEKVAVPEPPALLPRALTSPVIASPEEAAERFKALGDPTRLRIIAYLYCLLHEEAVSSGHAGSNGLEAPDAAVEELPPHGSATVNDICCHVTGKEKQNSTFSHHLKELRQAGLITMRKQGKTRLYRLDPKGIGTLLPYLTGQVKI